MKSIPRMKHALHQYAIGVKCSSTDNIIDSSASGRLLEICPRGNNKMLDYDPDCEIQKKTHLHVWKCKHQEFLVYPLRPAHVLTDDYVFLIMDIVLVTRMSVAMGTYC